MISVSLFSDITITYNIQHIIEYKKKNIVFNLVVEKGRRGVEVSEVT